jgi:hypothetical protein
VFIKILQASLNLRVGSGGARRAAQGSRDPTVTSTGEEGFAKLSTKVVETGVGWVEPRSRGLAVSNGCRAAVPDGQGPFQGDDAESLQPARSHTTPRILMLFLNHWTITPPLNGVKTFFRKT